MCMAVISWFVVRHDLRNTSSPLSLVQIINFIAFLSVNSYAPSTIAAYVSGLAATLRLHRLPDVTNRFIVRRLLEGCRRRNARQDQRLPFMIDTLHRIIPALNSVCLNQ